MSPTDALATLAAVAAPWAAASRDGDDAAVAEAIRNYLTTAAADHLDPVIAERAKHGFVYIDARTGRFASVADNAADPDHIIRLSIGRQS